MTRRFILLIALLAGLALPAAASAPMVGTVTFTCPGTSKQGGVWKCTWAWTSDASGNVSGNTKQLPYGYVIRVETDPGSTAPTDNYDVTLLDTGGIDIIQGVGADRDTANTETTNFSSPLWHDGSRVVDLTIANAGNAKVGVLTLWIRQ